MPRNGTTALRPSSVRAYSTRNGTWGYTVRMSNPASSRRRNVDVSTLGDTPSSRRRKAPKRCGASHRASMTITDHLLATISSSSRHGHCAENTFPRRSERTSSTLPCVIAPLSSHHPRVYDTSHHTNQVDGCDAPTRHPSIPGSTNRSAVHKTMGHPRRPRGRMDRTS